MSALEADPGVSSVAVLRGASLRPAGDVVLADLARESAEAVVERLRALELHRFGTIELDPVGAWLSAAGLEAERVVPGSSADTIVWPEVGQRAYDDVDLNWTYLSFMTLATLMSSIAIVTDSAILVIGAMVLGPEFGAVAAVAVGLVTARYGLVGNAVRTLLLGFAAGIAITTVVALVGRALGWITVAQVTGPRPQTGFISSPDRWTFAVALIAGAAGVLSLTSSKVGGLTGVFISVTTVPAAGNIALGLAVGHWPSVTGSTVQLLVNLVGMAISGWVMLLIVQRVWPRMPFPHRLRPPRQLG